MKTHDNSSGRFRPLAIAALALLTSVSALAQNRAPRLELDLELSTDEAEVGEAVTATVRLRNTGTSAAKVVTDLAPSYGFVTVEVTDTEKRIGPFVPLGIADRELDPVTIPPRGEISATFPVYFGGRGWTFPKPGTYTLRALLHGAGDKELQSKAVQLRVVRGDGAGRLLFGASREVRLETGKFLIWQQGDHLERAQAMLEKVISANPRSPLAQNAQLAIGLNLSRPFRDFTAGRVRPAQPEKALERFDAVDPARLPELLRIQRELGLARSYSVLGQEDAARGALDSARSAASGQAFLETLIEAEMRFDPALAEMKP